MTISFAENGSALAELAEPPIVISHPESLAERHRHDARLREEVLAILASAHPDRKFRERRSEQRYAYPHLIPIVPVATDGVTQIGEPLVVVGKNLSEHGIDFFHQEPLPHRRVLASLERNGRWIGLLVELTWCRFTRHGWYDSGGRLVRVLPSPLQEANVPAGNNRASRPMA